MGVVRDQELAVGARLVEVHRGGLGAAAQRRSVLLAAPYDLFLPFDRELLPVVEQHPDPAYDGVRAAGQPVVLLVRPVRDEDAPVEVALGGLGVVGAVDLAHQVAGGHRPRGGAGAAVEAVHLPADPGDRGGLLLHGTQRVEGDECVVGADLYPEVTVGALGVDVVGGEGRQRVESRWPVADQARAFEEGAAESEGDGQRGRSGIQRDPGVMARAVRSTAVGGFTGHQPAGHGRPPAHQGSCFLPSRAGRQIEGDEMAACLKRSGDPRLMFPVKHQPGGADRGQRGRLVGPGRGIAGSTACHAQDQPGRTGRTGAAEQPPPGDGTAAGRFAVPAACGGLAIAGEVLRLFAPDPPDLLAPLVPLIALFPLTMLLSRSSRSCRWSSDRCPTYVRSPPPSRCPPSGSGRRSRSSGPR